MENKPKVTSVLYGFLGAEKAFKSVRFDTFYEGEPISPAILEEAASYMIRRNPSIKEVYWVENSWSLASEWNHQFRSKLESVSVDFYMDVKETGYKIHTHI